MSASLVGSEMCIRDSNHDTFGLGQVVAVAGAGDNREVSIDFGEGTGTKRLLLRYAPVEKL